MLSGCRATQPPAHCLKRSRKNPAIVCFNTSTLFIPQPSKRLAGMRAEMDPLIHNAQEVGVVMGPAEGHSAPFKKCSGDFGDEVEASDTHTHTPQVHKFSSQVQPTCVAHVCSSHVHVPVCLLVTKPLADVRTTESLTSFRKRLKTQKTPPPHLHTPLTHFVCCTSWHLKIGLSIV